MSRTAEADSAVLERLPWAPAPAASSHRARCLRWSLEASFADSAKAHRSMPALVRHGIAPFSLEAPGEVGQGNAHTLFRRLVSTNEARGGRRVRCCGASPRFARASPSPLPTRNLPFRVAVALHTSAAELLLLRPILFLTNPVARCSCTLVPATNKRSGQGRLGQRA